MKDVLVPPCSDLRHSTCRPCYVVLILLLPLPAEQPVVFLRLPSEHLRWLRQQQVRWLRHDLLLCQLRQPGLAWELFEKFHYVTSPKMHSFLQTKQWRFSCITWTCQQFRWFLWWQEWQDWKGCRAHCQIEVQTETKSQGKSQTTRWTRCRSWSYRWSRRWRPRLWWLQWWDPWWLEARR